MTPPTAPREPLALTLGEAMRMLTGKGWWLDAPDDAWEVWTSDGFGALTCLAHEPTWPDALAIAFGRPVVARDEAAELRAAITEWVEADRARTEALDAGKHTAFCEACDRRYQAAAALRRLAGEEDRE